MTSLSLKGPLDEPSRWDFSSAGTLGKIAVKHAKLPAVMNLSGGKFSATPAKLTVSNAKVNLLDAALTVDGSLESPDRAPLASGRHRNRGYWRSDGRMVQPANRLA